MSLGAPLLLLEIVQAYPLLHKGLGHLASLYLLYLLVSRYYLFCNLHFQIYTAKIPKIFILLSLSYLTFASGREAIDNPLSHGLQGSYLFVQVLCNLRVVSYWIDTLVLKN